MEIACLIMSMGAPIAMISGGLLCASIPAIVGEHGPKMVASRAFAVLILGLTLGSGACSSYTESCISETEGKQ